LSGAAFMAITQRIELRQSQSLVMTPQLMQAIKLLQMSSMDLSAYVDTELERNPLLERAETAEAAGERTGDRPDDRPEDRQEDRPEDRQEDRPENRQDDEPRAADGEGERGTEPPAPPAEDSYDAELSNIYPDDHIKPAEETAPALPAESWSVPVSRQAVGSSSYNVEAFVAGQTTLADHLLEQFGLAVQDPQARLIGHAIINEIDEAGYFRGDLVQMAERLGASESEIVQVLRTVQSLEPTGVGARDLAECLAIQLCERDRLDPAMQALLNHLDLAGRRDFSRLRALCGVDQDDLADMIGELRSLDPKPGNAFGGGPVQLVVPDVTVRAGPDGHWLVDLNNETLPRVLVNQSYYATVSVGRRSDADRAFLSDCMQTANWLVKSLEFTVCATCDRSI